MIAGFAGRAVDDAVAASLVGTAGTRAAVAAVAVAAVAQLVGIEHAVAAATKLAVGPTSCVGSGAVRCTVVTLLEQLNIEDAVAATHGHAVGTANLRRHADGLAGLTDRDVMKAVAAAL